MAPGPNSRHGGCDEAQQRLHAARDEAALAIEKKEGDHSHQRRQRHRQGDDGAEDAAAGKLGAFEEKGERHADQRRQHHRSGGDPQAPPQGQPLVRPAEELAEEAQRPAPRPAERLDQRHQQGVSHEPREERGDGEGGEKRGALHGGLVTSGGCQGCVNRWSGMPFETSPPGPLCEPTSKAVDEGEPLPPPRAPHLPGPPLPPHSRPAGRGGS